MRNYFFLFLVIIGMTLNANAQAEKDTTVTPPKNAFYFELLGKGLLGSINYERRLLKKTDLSLSIGVGGIPNEALLLPVALHYAVPVSKSKKGFLEIGAGFSFINGTSGDLDTIDGFATFSVGYKKNFGKNWFWKANMTQLIYEDDDNFRDSYNIEVLPSVGFSIGKRF